MLKEQHPSLNLHKAAEGWLVQKEIFQIAGKKKWEFFVCICKVLSRAASTALLTDILVIFMLCLETQKMRCRRTNAMDREGDDLVTRLTKLFAFLLELILSFPQVLAAEAAEPFSKDALSIPSLDEDTAIYAGTWVADSEEQAFLLLGNEKVLWLAVATQMEDGAYQLIAQSKPVLSYETYCSGSVEMMDKWDDGRPYFWYSIGHYINYYLLASDAGDGTWIVHSGYIDAHGGYTDVCEEDIHFNFYISDSEDYFIVFDTAFPQIEWPIGDHMKLEGFDITIIQKECEDALEYLDEFDKTHGLDEQDDTYKIIWDW
jgi:hypothetical protein